MSDYSITDSGLKATPELRVKRFKSRYPELFQNKNFDLEALKAVYNQIPEVRDFMLITYPKDCMGYSIMTLFMRLGRYEDALIINAYTLLDIYLGKSEDYQSISDIENRVVCVYLGYSEFENRRQSDIIEQLMEQQRVHGGKFWLLYKGTDIREKYPKLTPLIEDNQGLVVHLKFKSNVDEEEEI